MKNNAILARDYLIENFKPKFAFDGKQNYSKWKKTIREKFLEVTGLNNIALNACAPSLEVKKETQRLEKLSKIVII